MKNNLYTIPAQLPFADTFARWVLEEYGKSGLDLPRMLVLLPTRRASRALREAFLRISEGRPLLLPRIQPLDDVDGDLLLAAPLDASCMENAPPPAFSMKRLFILARLIERFHPGEQRMDYSLQLAQELAWLLDEMEREQVSLAGLKDLVPDTFAAHWQKTVEFLQILSEHWPGVVEDEKLVSIEGYRRRMLETLAEHWRTRPPSFSVIAAGTTGSIPATANLLKAILALPQGAVVLPGLDTESEDAYFANLAQAHPQWGMAQLLKKLGRNRSDVDVIGGAQSPRARLLAEALRPPETLDRWQLLSPDMKNALAGLSYVACANPQEEATAIALMLREVAGQPEKTAALVTHDRTLARRVAGILERFGIAIDDSAGTPLAQMPAGGFMRLVLEVAATGAGALPLLSLLKHPLAHAGLTRIECLENARALELFLRGDFAVEGFAGIRLLLTREGASEELCSFAQLLEQSFAPLMQLFNVGAAVPLVALVEAHLQCADALAAKVLWEGLESDALAQLLTQLKESSAHAGDLRPDTYPALFETLLAGIAYRPRYGMHPRLKILSPIGARMQTFDRIILGSLNEESWPPANKSDPWFNRPMRAELGLPSPEERIGLAAHDFVQLASGGEVILTRAEKSDGAPTTPSRWLVKLTALLEKFSLKEKWEDHRWAAWARMLDEAAEITPWPRPEPTPPASARPRRLSVTEVETWMRDPYAIYAKHILGLRPLDPLEPDPTRADFGKVVHRALEQFVNAFPDALPDDAEAQLLDLGRKALAPLSFSATARAWWWPRFARLARWVVEEERKRRGNIVRIWAEVSGTLRIGKNFLLTGRADRIEKRKDGSVAIIDYKTGGLPGRRDTDEGLANQLTLLALMASVGTMEAPTVGKNIASLEYWQLQGGRNAGKTDEPFAKSDLSAQMQAAKEKVEKLVREFDNPEQPYRSIPDPARAPRYSDYAHLARVKEWG